jgi:5'-methylthioadenosine phosphorylase
MEGPAFSTRAESFSNHRLGYDVIGMTNLGEAKCAREAEIAYATMSDDHRLRLLEGRRSARHGRDGDREPSAQCGHRKENHFGSHPADSCRAKLAVPLALQSAIMTDKKLWPAKTKRGVGAIAEKIFLTVAAAVLVCQPFANSRALRHAILYPGLFVVGRNGDSKSR